LAHARADPVTAPVTVTASAGRWSDFWTRLASTAILGPLALLALWLGGIAWAALIGLMMLGLGLEWSRLANIRRESSTSVLPAFAGLTAWLFGPPAGVAALVFATAFAWQRFGRFAAAGMPYIGIGALCLLWLRLVPAAGLMDPLFLVAVIWSTDIGAYLIGRIIGGARMAPRISPGKTWSGAMGGLVFAAIAGLVLAGLDPRALPAALLLSVAAQAGDLLESAIKRKLGVKDSGNTIPGHGGLFDRLDGFLVAAPVAVLLVLFASGGLPLWR
jgi:phosphatidate cytidylyltransferase